MIFSRKIAIWWRDHYKSNFATLGPSWPTHIIWSIISDNQLWLTVALYSTYSGLWNSFTNKIYLYCNLDPNIFLGTNIFLEPKNFSHPEQSIGPKKFWIQKYLRLQNILDSKKLFGPQKLWTPNQKIWPPKHFGPKKLFDPKKILGHKSFGPWKYVNNQENLIFVPPTILAQKFFGLRIFGHKNFCYTNKDCKFFRKVRVTGLGRWGHTAQH